MSATPWPGVFAFEGEWNSNLKKRLSVRPLVKFLEDSQGVKTIYKDIGTREEFFFYLDRWLQPRYKDHPIGMFAFHGTARTLHLGDSKVTLDELASKIDGRAKGRILYFGGCKILELPNDEIEELRRVTRARAVVGYTKDVDFLESAAFELLLIDCLSTFDKSPSRAKRQLLINYPNLSYRLGLKFVHATRAKTT